MPDHPLPGRDNDADRSPPCVLRLYVSGTMRCSGNAIASLRRICETHLQNRYDLEVVDVYQNPAATRQDQVVAVLTLVKLRPGPLRRVIGNPSDHEKVLAELEIVPENGSGG